MSRLLPFYFADVVGLNVLVLGGILVLAPEEVLFHGIIQTQLNSNVTGPLPRWRPLRGTVVAATMFAVSHSIDYVIAHDAVTTVFSILSAFAFGLINGIWYERTHDLRGCVLAHVIGNILTNVP